MLIMNATLYQLVTFGLAYRHAQGMRCAFFVFTCVYFFVIVDESVQEIYKKCLGPTRVTHPCCQGIN